MADIVGLVGLKCSFPLLPNACPPCEGSAQVVFRTLVLGERASALGCLPRAPSFAFKSSHFAFLFFCFSFHSLREGCEVCSYSRTSFHRPPSALIRLIHHTSHLYEIFLQNSLRYGRYVCPSYDWDNRAEWRRQHTSDQAW
jgi:hypothetical protein